MTRSRYSKSSRNSPWRNALGKVAVRRRNDADVRVPEAPCAPTDWISPVSRKRRSSACMRRLISPTSSRKSVPRCASCSLPGLSRYAPVKLPLTWPKSSDSRSVSVNPAQFTATKGPCDAGRVHVDGPRDQILADAALARHENLGLSHCRPPGHGQHFEHGGTCRNDVRLPAGHFVVAAFRMSAFRDVQHDTGSLCGPGALPPAICRASGAPALPVD